MFNVNLHEIFREIFIISKATGFSAEYLESITPIERTFYWNYYLEEEKRSQDSTPDSKVFTPLSTDIPKAINSPPGLNN